MIASIVRTFVTVCLFALILGGAFVVMIQWRVPIYVHALVLTGLLSLGIYGVSRYAPMWAPIVRPIAHSPWSRSDGTRMETVVEIAAMHSDESVHECYRVSIYETDRRRRVRCQLIGDQVDYLGVFESGVWFLIHNGFYARKTGLVCLDIRTLKWVYHDPSLRANQSSPSCELGVLSVIKDGEEMRIDLRTVPPTEVTT